jgi:hypothetical protein
MNEELKKITEESFIQVDLMKSGWCFKRRVEVRTAGWLKGLLLPNPDLKSQYWILQASTFMKCVKYEIPR